MEISPVSLDQIVSGRDGREYVVSGQAGRIAARLAELDPPLKCSFNEGGMYFAIYQVVDQGSREVEQLVGRVPMDEWDDRVVKDFALRAWELRNGVSPADRLDKLEADATARREQAFDDAIGEAAYPIMRAIQRELVGTNPRIFVPARKAAA